MIVFVLVGTVEVSFDCLLCLKVIHRLEMFNSNDIELGFVCPW